MKKFIKKVIPIFLAVVLLFCTTVVGVSANTESYRDKFINELINNQTFWDYNNNNYKFYFCDIDFDSNLELICERDIDSMGNVWVETFGFSNGKIFKYYIGRAYSGNTQTYIQDNFSLYYDTNKQNYSWFSLKSYGGICCDIENVHNCYSNFELAVYDKRIYKDYFTAYCAENGYYELYRKADVELGYIPGSYNYNISGPDDDKKFYDSINSERFSGLIKATVTKKYVSFDNFRNCSSVNKRKLLEESYDSFKYNYKTDESTTQATEGKLDYCKYNPFECLGMSFDEITNTFGNDYTKVEERESGLHKIICYPDTGNPFEFGFDNDTDLVKCIWIYDLTEDPIKLFDDITNKSTLEDMEKSNTSFTYSKWVGENVFDDNNIEQNVTYKLNDGIIVSFEWTSNDFNKQPANRVLVMQGEVENTTSADTTVAPTTTKSNIKPTSSTNATSLTSTADTATSDSVNNDNGTIQTGVISISVIVVLLLASLATGGFAWYRRKIK